MRTIPVVLILDVVCRTSSLVICFLQSSISVAASPFTLNPSLCHLRGGKICFFTVGSTEMHVQGINVGLLLNVFVGGLL